MDVVKSLKNLRLSAKLNALIIFVLGLLLVAIVFTLRRSTDEMSMRTGRYRIEQETAVIRSRFDELGSRMLDNVTFIANTPGLIEAMSDADPGRLRTIILTQSAPFDFDDVDLVDMHQTRLLDIEVEGSEDENALLSLGLMGIRTTGIVIETAEDQDNEQVIFKLAATSPVINPAGELVGAVVVARVVGADFLTELNLARTDPHVALVLEGKVVASDQWDPAILADFVPAERDLQRAFSGHSVVVSEATVLANDLHTVGYAPLIVRGETKGIIAVVYNLEALTTFENQLTAQTGMIFLILTLVALALLATFTQLNVVRPIERLQSVARQMAGGNYAIRADTTTDDEIGKLGLAFNQMTRAVQEREKELKASRRIADENSRLKSEFLATMSHELRTPLNAIEGYTSIMLAGMGVELQPNVKMMLERMAANSKRLLALINDFLDLSRIESGRMDLVHEPITPRELASKLATEVGGLAQQKALDFRVNVDQTLPDVVYGDEEAIMKIAVNLLGNAVKFTREGHIALNLKSDTNTWAIEVSDTGIGIPPHAREFIFDEFRQVDGSSRREFGGTGLGLAIVSKLTRAMGGNVTLTSEVGQGSVFTVTLPLQPNGQN